MSSSPSPSELKPRFSSAVAAATGPLTGSSFCCAVASISSLPTASANVAEAASSAGASSATCTGGAFCSAASFSGATSGPIPSTTGLAVLETAAIASAGASTANVSAVAVSAFTLADISASFSRFSTAAVIAEAPVIRTASVSPPDVNSDAGAAAGIVAGIVPNVRNISATSEIAASSGLNITGSAIHRGPAALRAASSASNCPAATRVPCDGIVETSACPVAGVSKRNASASSASLGAGSSASAASGTLAATGTACALASAFNSSACNSSARASSGFGSSGFESRSCVATASAGALASATSLTSPWAIASTGFASIFSSTACSAIPAEANIGSSVRSTGAGSCTSSAVFTAATTTGVGVSELWASGCWVSC